MPKQLFTIKLHRNLKWRDFTNKLSQFQLYFNPCFCESNMPNLKTTPNVKNVLQKLFQGIIENIDVKVDVFQLTIRLCSQLKVRPAKLDRYINIDKK